MVLSFGRVTLLLLSTIFFFFVSCGRDSQPKNIQSVFQNKPRLAQLVQAPSVNVQAALARLNEAHQGKLVEAFHLHAPNLTPYPGDISFTEMGKRTPYLVCYFNIYNEKTHTNHLTWNWGVHTEKIFRSLNNTTSESYWKQNGYVSLANESRYPNLSFVSQYSREELNNLCQDSMKYWQQPRSLWKLEDDLNPEYTQLPSNAQFSFYEEAKTNLGYSRHLFSQDESHLTKLTSLVAFGDSLSDTGNIYRRTGHTIPRNDYYYSGRFTNGFNWLDDVEHTLNIPVYNSAYGSAETSNKVLFGVPLSVLDALQEYTTHQGYWDGYYYGGFIGHSSTGDGEAASTLFSVFAGGNNYVDLIEDNNFPGGIKFHNPKQSGTYLNSDDFVEQTVEDLKEASEKIIALGGKYILLPNLPDLSQVPVGIESGHPAELKSIVKNHNQKLYATIVSLSEKYPDVTFIHMDISSVLNDMIEHASDYGFSNVKTPCFIGKFFNLEGENKPSLCGDLNVQDTYLYWDHIHPTRKAHGILAYMLTDFLYSKLGKD